jgi:poly-gamma-glutamate synthesis protein (capsule biosynthesis protein)
MRYPTRILSCLLAFGGLSACSDTADDDTAPVTVPDPSGDSEDGEAYTPFDPNAKADGLTLPGGPLIFDAACAEGETLSIAAVGDVLLHGRLQKQAFAADNGFVSLWAGTADLMAAADVTYANLEGPTAMGVDKRGRAVDDPGKVFDDRVYSSYPMFNYHPQLLTDLMASGVDVVSTANNHSLDRWSLGADRTLDALKEAGLPYTGTRYSDGTGDWFTITETKGFRLAWLACTYGTNGIPDRKDQVLLCHDHRDAVLAEIKTLAARDDVDAVIVTPHWGSEYKANPNQKEVDLAHDMIDAGALAVIGSHPHVLQPWERYVTEDGREGFAIYSLGNFVSGQRHLPRRSTLLLYLGLTRTADGVKINGARYVPLHMTRDNAGMHLDVIDRVDDFGDSRQLTVDMFGPYNLFPPQLDTGVITNPQCDPEWIAPHPHDGWIGGSCADADVCGGGICLSNAPDGLCSESCERFCPDRAGRPGTFCVDFGFDNGGVCVPQCAADEDCRPGYACVEAERYKEEAVKRTVCLPSE